MSLAFQWLSYHQCNPAPGVVQWTPTDYEVAEAERQGGLIVPGPTGGGEVPLFVYNSYPQYMMGAPTTALLGEWGGAGAAGGHFESWAMPREFRMKTGVGFYAQVMNRYKSSLAVGGWNIYAGSPGVEFGFHDHPFALQARVNLSPYIQLGKKNTLELWPFATMTVLDANPKATTSKMNIENIRIGIVPE